MFSSVKFHILNSSINENAYKYMTRKQGEKGKDISHSGLEMSEYLLPTNDE